MPCVTRAGSSASSWPWARGKMYRQHSVTGRLQISLMRSSTPLQVYLIREVGITGTSGFVARLRRRCLSVNCPNMFQTRLEILPPAQASLWPLLTEVPAQFVLYGGTALALRLGHRFSVDFDFFSAASFDAEAMQQSLSLIRHAEVLQKTANTLTVRTPGGVRLSFFGGLSLGQIEHPAVCADNSLHIAGLKDLFATKLNVIYQRSEAKDYRDVDALIQAGLPLALGLGCARAVYGSSFNIMLPLKALAYFADGDLPSLLAETKARLLAATRSVQDVPVATCCSDRIGC